MNFSGFPFRYRLIFLAVGFWAVVGFASLLPAAELRTWSDSTGQFKIEARFDSVQGDLVFLKKSDGTSIKIPLDKLSNADRDYVKQQASTPRNPFDTGEKTPSGTSEATQPSGAMLKNQLARSDWLSARALNLVMTGSWKPLQGGTARPSAIPNPKPFQIPPKNDFFDNLAGKVINTQAGVAGICYKNDGKMGQKQSAYSCLAICDLKRNGRVINRAIVPDEYVLLDIDNSGKLAMVRTAGQESRKNNIAEIWSIGGKEVVRGMQWIPFEQNHRAITNQPGNRTSGASGFGTQGFDTRGFGNPDMDHHPGFGNINKPDGIAWGKFLGNNQALICSTEGMVSAWDLTACKVLWYIQTNKTGVPALSPDGRYYAFSAGKSIGIVDIPQKKLVASINPPSSFSTHSLGFAFSPNMKMLAASTSTHLFVWNLANGELLREMKYIGRGTALGGSIDWVDNQYVLVSGNCLIDAANLIQAWGFQGGTGIVRGGYVWFMCGRVDMMGFIPIKLPHPEMLAKLEKAKKDPNFFILKPGTVVKLDVSGIQSDRNKVRDILTKKLQEKGFKAGGTGTIALVASQKLGEREEHSYHRFGHHKDMTFNIQDYISELKFVYQGKEVWKRSNHSVPSFLSASKDESFEKKIRETEKHTTNLFERTDLPQRLMNSENGTTFGSSSVTPNGLK